MSCLSYLMIQRVCIILILYPNNVFNAVEVLLQITSSVAEAGVRFKYKTGHQVSLPTFRRLMLGTIRNVVKKLGVCLILAMKTA
jgi:hypothetical protein